MQTWHAAQRPQGVLQPFRQGSEAFATQNDVGMLKPTVGEAEMIEAVIQ
jgi:hypothetical protein